jgi:16S rRNA (adenine1518-N6/adenine1519-N6)-dimethyltransferase
VDEERFLDFVKLCFGQKRKTLVNNLRSRGTPDVVRQALTLLDLRPDARAEQLSVAELATVWKSMPSAEPRKTSKKN